MAAHSVGVGDAWYCGDNDEYVYEFYNITDDDVKVEKGEVLVQGMLIKPEEVVFEEVEKMDEEGNGGYSVKP
jgi:dUTPase